MLDVVFANCLFDFCEAAQIEEILLGVRRVLRPGGSLFAVYMGEPDYFPFLSVGEGSSPAF